MKHKINLLRKEEKEKNLIDKLIYFSLNYLRYILVITQLIVIFVFFYKFKTDQEIIDLKESLDQKKEIVTISRSLLDDATKYELKIDYIKPILEKQKKRVEEIDYLLSIFPESLILSKMEIKEGEIVLNCYSHQSNIIKIFYNRLIKEKKYKKVDLNNLKKTETGYVFNLLLKNYDGSS